MRFALGDVLSVTTGHLVSRDHIDGVYRILNFMTGDSLFTHQLPRASDEATPEILCQHPQLGDVVVPDWSGVPRDQIQDTVMVWLSEMEAVYGETLELEPLVTGDHTSIDPVAELKMMRPDMPVVVVEVPGSGE